MSNDNRHARLLDQTGILPATSASWRPLKVPAALIEDGIERLAAAPRPANGRRSALIVHPESGPDAPGLAPGVQVAINVLLPGEATTALRCNTAQVELTIRGGGVLEIGERALRAGRFDVCTIPSMRLHRHRNDGSEPWVRLTYSNAPLLQRLGVLYVEEGGEDAAPAAGRGERSAHNRETAPDIQVSPEGARVRGYEFLTDIQVVDNQPLHWPWEEVSAQLSSRPDDGKRTILLLYNPATERRNGTTHSFFATMTRVPAGSPPRPRGRGHRHSSVAINYHFAGSGSSEVAGETIEWQAGDLLLSAPGWAEHAHFISPEGASILTIQDHPLHIGMESLIWQERMDGPILTLGSEPGQTGYVGPRQAGD